VGGGVGSKVRRKIFGSKKNAVKMAWIKLHNKDFFIFTLHHIRVMKSRKITWAGNVIRVGEIRNAYKILVCKPGKNILLVRPRRRWDNYNKLVKKVKVKLSLCFF
jgi:hypothetical protein